MKATEVSKLEITSELKDLRKYMGTLTIPHIIETEDPKDSVELTELLNKVRLIQDNMGVIVSKYELGAEKEQLNKLGESMDMLGTELTTQTHDNSFQLAILKEQIVSTLDKLEDIRIKNMSDKELESEIQARIKPREED